MTDKVIYYPYIRVPHSSWFNNVLLYWDQVGSIIPSTNYLEEIPNTDHMKTLISEGLVKAIIPENYNDVVNNKMQEFLIIMLHMEKNN